MAGGTDGGDYLALATTQLVLPEAEAFRTPRLRDISEGTDHRECNTNGELGQRSARDDLLAFIDRDDIPILAQAAVAHAQFETIHPFADENGRTGRALVHAQLRNKRLTRNVTVPVSAELLTDTDSYFAALTAYRNGDLVTIVEQFTTAAFGALANGRHLVDDLRSIRTEWTDRIRARRDSGTWKIADLLLRHPVVNAAFLADELAVAPQNTYRSLARLVEAEVVVEFTDRKRNQMWRSPEVLDALERFAARAGRRTGAAR